MKKTTFKFMIANRGTVALVMVVALAFSAMVPVVADTKPKTTRALTEEQKIVHLLNRTGFGARPGDIERVRAMGIEKYLDQQLHPERINDSATEARLKRLESLNMTIAEIYEKYPQPNLIANQLGIGKKQQAKQNDQMNPNSNNQADDVVDLTKRENRQALMAYYREHGLKLPAMLLGDLMEQKIIRGISSERQLEELMTDFWYNHFNIFWGKGADEKPTDYRIRDERDPPCQRSRQVQRPRDGYRKEPRHAVLPG